MNFQMPRQGILCHLPTQRIQAQLEYIDVRLLPLHHHIVSNMQVLLETSIVLFQK